MASPKQHLLIIDAPSLIFRAFHAMPPLTTPDGEPAGALYGFIMLLIKAIEATKPTHIVAALDLPEPTFRHKAYKEYKATRPKMPEELSSQFSLMPDVLKGFGIQALAAPGFEADDVIATVAERSRAKNPSLSVTVLTSDLDALQLVSEKVVVLAPYTGMSKTVRYTKKAVHDRFGIGPEIFAEYKALRGDPSDNIPGVSGIGEKGASQILMVFGSLDEALRAACTKDFQGTESQKRIVQRYGAKLCAAKNQLPELLDLVTLRREAPVKFSADGLVFRGINTPSAQALLSRFGFRRLLGQVSSGKARKKSEHKALEAFISEQEENVRAEIAALEKSGVLSSSVAGFERELIPIISAMERRGILLDRAHLAGLSREFATRQAEISERIYTSAGLRFNLSSPKQVSEVLFRKLGIASSRRTKTGAASSARDVLEELSNTHEIVADLLKFREIEKLLTTYVNALPKLVDPGDHRIHAHFWQLGTTTGRIASSNPNLQQIPVKTPEGRRVREAFVPSTGKVFLSVDYSQMELRIAAILADDKAMCDAFRAGHDIHRVTASKIFSVSETEVTQAQRSQAKTLNFGILYGMGPRRLARETKMSQDEAQAFIGAYFTGFPGIARWIEKTKNEARRQGFVETAFGRKRFLPDIQAEDLRLRAEAERAAVNMPVQGTGADLVKQAMVKCAAQVPEAELVVQVHDELLFEAPLSRQKEIREVVSGVLERIWPQAPLPFSVDVKWGARWGRLEG